MINVLMNVITNIIPFLVFLFLNIFVCIVSKKKFGSVLPLTLTGSVFIVYILQFILGTFKAGIYLLLLLALLGVALYIYKGIKVGVDVSNKLIITNGFYAFIAIFIIFLIIDFNRYFYMWDEYMHWGKMVKEMLRLDKFYYVNESVLLRHKDYPPFISVFETIWCFLSGGYSEMRISMAIHVYLMSIVTPFLFEKNELDNKGFLKNLHVQTMITLAFIVLICYLDAYMSFNTVYADILVGLMFSYSMYLVFTREAVSDLYSYAAYVMIMFGILNIKQIGITFFGISIAYFTYMLVLENKKFTKSKLVAMWLIPIILSFTTYYLWNRAVNMQGNVQVQFDIKNKVNILDACRYVIRPGYQHDTIQRFATAIFEKSLVKGYLPITYAAGIILVCVVLEILHRFNKDKLAFIEKIVLQVLLFGGAVGYALVMLLLYIFCFEKNETDFLWSFPRYMGSYLTGALILVVFIAINIYYKRITAIKPYYLTLFVLLEMIVLDSSNMVHYMPQIFKEDKMAAYREMADPINEIVEPGKSVYVNYSKTNDDIEQVTLAYYTDGINIAEEWMDIQNIDYSADENAEQLQAAIDMLKKYDYMYTIQVTDSFNQSFASYNNGQPFEFYSIYRIDSDGNNLEFNKINK